MSERIPAGGPYRAAIGIHEPLTLEHLRLARSLVSSYCRSMEFCVKYIEKVSKAALLVAKARVNDLVGTEYSGLDSELISLFNRFIDFYAGYLAGLYVIAGEDVIARAKTTFKIPQTNAWALEGDIVKLKAHTAMALFVAGLIEPVESFPLKTVKDPSRQAGETS